MTFDLATSPSDLPAGRPASWSQHHHIAATSVVPVRFIWLATYGATPVKRRIPGITRRGCARDYEGLDFSEHKVCLLLT